jgi:hypothetical protein
MKGVPKTRFSGIFIIIVLFLILIIGLFTMVSRYSNEQKLIKRGFVTLQRNSGALKGKLRIFSIKNYNFIKGSIKNDSSVLAQKKDSLKKNLYAESNINKINDIINRNSDILSDKEIHFKKLKPISYNDGGIVVNFENEKSQSHQDLIVNDTLTINNGFFSDILDRDFFDDYVIFDSEQIFYKSFATEIDQKNFLGVLKKNIYLPAAYKIFTGKKDSSILLSSWNSGFISKTIINYKRYFQFVYPIKINNSTWYISGLLSNQHYLDKKRHVETWVLIFTGILLIFALFSFQFLKLFLLSKTERVNTSDIVYISFSIAGIACIGSLLILNINSAFSIKHNCYRQLKDLNKTINDNFITELNLMYNLAESYEKSSKSNKEEYLLSNTQWSNVDTGLRKAVNNYACFTNLFCSNKGWADSILSTTKKASSPKISYRQYYLKKDEWILPGSNPEKNFRIESIYSNLTGEVLAVLAKPANNGSRWVYCVATPMYSVMNTVLPPGFEFRIIGNDGTVWFHNNKKKNNRENFLDECDHNDEVLESIHNRVGACIPLKISLKNYRSCISPIGTLPLYLVTLCNTKQQNEFFSHINYILFVFILLGISLALLSTCLFYYEKLNSSVDDTKYQDYEPGLLWLMPDTRKNTKYLIITAVNLLVGLFISLCFLFRGITVIHIILIMFTAYSVCFICYYYLLKSHEKGVFKKSVIILFAIIFLLSNIIYCTSLRNPYLFLILEILAILLVCTILIKSKEVDFSKVPSILKLKNDAYIPYTLFVSSWMGISCVLPSILLFRTAGREEIELQTKENQIEIATRVERKNLDIDSLFINYIKKEKLKTPNLDTNKVAKLNLDSIKSSLKGKGNYLLSGFIVDSIHATINQFVPDIDRNNRYIHLNRYLRQMFRKEDVRSFQMLNNIGLDKVWFWKGGYLSSLKSDYLDFYYKSRQKNADGFFESGQIKISSYLPEQTRFYKTDIFGLIAIHFLTFLSIILFLYLIIFLIVKHVFILKDNYNINRNKGSAIPREGLIFLISSLDQENVKTSFHKTHILVSLDNPDAIGSLKNIMINFNPYPEKIMEWIPLFKSLEKHIETNSVNIILLSSCSPQQTINMIEEMYQKAASEMKDVLRDFRIRLVKIFSNFKVYFIENDKFIQDLSSNEYQYLWEKCTVNEKFILSDLAFDAIVNAKNNEDIKNLIGKGILEVQGKLTFINHGFKKYIMELAGTDEFKYLDMNSKRSDGWNRVKLPIYIIFGAVVLFFFFTQQEIVSTISAAVLSLTGLIGSLLKFGASARSVDIGK